MQRDIATFTGKTGAIRLHLVGLGLREAGSALPDDREDAADQSATGSTAASKIACEELLRDQDALPYTIVRPSHTVRTGMPIQVGDADTAIRRMLAGKPVIVAGDGSSLWTLTRSDDSRGPSSRLLGNAKALGEDFHITTDRGFTWNQIHEAIARGFGVEAMHAHVPTDDARPLQQGLGGPADRRQDLDGALRQHQGQGVAGNFAASEDLDENPRGVGQARQGAAEGAGDGDERRGGRPHRPHHRGAGGGAGGGAVSLRRSRLA